jgi:hypothetical protein
VTVGAVFGVRDKNPTGPILVFPGRVVGVRRRRTD